MDAEADTDHQQAIRGNVTVDPLSSAVPVTDPAIKEVIDLETGEFVETGKYIGEKRYEELIAARLAMRDRLSDRPMFGCALCTTPVYLVANQLKHFFFRHTTEDGSCPAQTRGDLSQDEIRARKYHGQRESAAHRKIKGFIERSLAADPAFSNVLSEKQWRSTHDPQNRRQPDVQAIGSMGRMAFEVQLSTTFLDVVVERRKFYREEGGLLIWVMGYFDPAYRRLTTDDLLLSNNSNIFVVDEETTGLSEESRKFHLRCHHREPGKDGGRLVDRWETRIVSFDALTFEANEQRAWHFDYEGKAAAIRSDIEREERERGQAEEEALRQRFMSFWLARTPYVQPTESQLETWGALSRDFDQRGITLPEHPNGDRTFIALMNGLMSANAGHPVGSGFKQLIEVAHIIANAHPQHLAALGTAFRHFGRDELLEQQDKTAKWGRRKIEIREALKERRTSFKPDLATLPLVELLFPEIGKKVRKLAGQWPDSSSPNAE